MTRDRSLDQKQASASCRCSFPLVSHLSTVMAQLGTSAAYSCQRMQRFLGLGSYGSSACPLLATTWLLLWVWSAPDPLLNPGGAGPSSPQQQQQQQQQQWFLSFLQPVAALPSAVPASVAAHLAGLHTSMQTVAAALSPLQLALLGATTAWMLMELAFYLFWFLPVYKQWNARCNAHESAAAQGTAECYALFRRFMEFSRSAPCQLDFLYAYLSTWFRGAAPQDIKRENMEELFAYGFFYRTREQLNAVGLDHLPNEMTAEFEDCFDFKFPPGYNPNLQFMSHLWEDLRVSWRPLAFYAVMEALAFIAAFAMWAMGFRRQQFGELHYYARGIPEHQATSSRNKQQQQQPVVFIHGVAGLLLYLPLLARLAALQAPLLVLDMKHVGLRLSTSIPTVDALAAALAAALQHHQLPPALVVAHSYGTLVAGRLLRLQRSVVASVLFVDPVCFGMFMPRLLHGFIYATLKLDWSKPLAAAFNMLLWLVSKDIHLAATFARNFYWSDLNLWPEDLPEGSCVVLSGADALVSSEEIGIMLSGSPQVQVMFKPDLIHGGFMLDCTTRNEVMTTVQTLAGAVRSAATATGAAAGAGAVTPSAADVAAAVMDAEPAPHSDQTAAALPDRSSSPFGLTLDNPDQPDQDGEVFDSKHSHRLSAVDELTASHSNSSGSCNSCGRDLIIGSDQDFQDSGGRCSTAPQKVARRHTYDVVASSAADTMFSDSECMDQHAGKDLAAAAKVVATAAANGAAAAALLVAAARPAGLWPSYCSHCCCHCWEEQGLQQRLQLTPTLAVERRSTVH